MSEQDPSITLHYNGDEEFEMRPENSTLYTFMGRTAIGSLIVENESVNHIFVNMAKKGETPRGMYLFKQFHPVFTMLSGHMVEHRYPMILNQREIPECDMRAYMLEVDKTTAKFVAEIPDSLPNE